MDDTQPDRWARILSAFEPRTRRGLGGLTFATLAALGLAEAGAKKKRKKKKKKKKKPTCRPTCDGKVCGDDGCGDCGSCLGGEVCTDQGTCTAATAYEFVREWGSSGQGNGEFSGPGGIARDGDGNIFVTEEFGNRVQKFEADGTFVTKWGTFGTGNGAFDTPLGIAVDETGAVFVVDAGNDRVQKFSQNAQNPQQYDFVTTWGEFGGDDGQFKFPRGVDLDDDGDVYVADSDNNRVQKFAQNEQDPQQYDFVTTWGSFGEDEDGKFRQPKGIAVAEDGVVYVADTGNDQVQEFAQNAQNPLQYDFVTRWGSSGVAAGAFDDPKSIAIDAAGSLYVADTDNHRIQKFDRDGNFLAEWGAPGDGEGEFDGPEDVVIDDDGNVYVADQGNNRIQVFAPTSGAARLGAEAKGKRGQRQRGHLRRRGRR